VLLLLLPFLQTFVKEKLLGGQLSSGASTISIDSQEVSVRLGLNFVGNQDKWTRAVLQSIPLQAQLMIAPLMLTNYSPSGAVTRVIACCMESFFGSLSKIPSQFCKSSAGKV
jgi:hypothetical protein